MRTYWHDRLLARSVLRWIPHEARPNHITLFRILLTPLVVWLIWRESYAAGIILFLFLAFTDALDGSLARVRKCVTSWGMMMDPVADKLLIGSVAAILLLRHFPAELAIAIFGVEAMFLIGGYFRKRQGIIVSANLWGKIKMILQTAGISMYLISLLVGGSAILDYASYGTLVAATVFALISLFSSGL